MEHAFLGRGFRIPSHVLHQEVGDEIILLNLETGIYFGLDDVGAIFWKSIVDGEGPGEAYDTILHQFEADPDVVVRDLERLTTKLIRDDLLEETTRSPGEAE